jgi:hypothetical protein
MTRPVLRTLRLMLVTVMLASLSMTLPTRFIERAPAPLKSLLSGIAPAAEAAAAHPANGKIAFESERTGNKEIFVMDPDGTNQVRLTNNPSSDQAPGFSPDGTKILFQRHINGTAQIVITNADGSNLAELTTSGSNFSPIFSPAGDKIAFNKTQSGTQDIFVMNSDGSGQVRLTNNTVFDGVANWQTVISPDTIGVYRPSSNQFILGNANTARPSSTTITFGTNGDQPLFGDWNGDGRDDVGVFRPNTGQFLLRLSTVSKACAICNPFPVIATLTINFGQFGDLAVVGDWDGDGKDTIGVWRTFTGQFFLSNSNTSPPVSDFILTFGGLSGDLPVVGDWNGDGKDTIGIHGVPRNGEAFPNGVGFFLNNSNTVAANDLIFGFGQSGDIPLAGDWNGGN